MNVGVKVGSVGTTVGIDSGFIVFVEAGDNVKVGCIVSVGGLLGTGKFVVTGEGVASFSGD